MFEALTWAGALEEKLRPHKGHPEDQLLWAIRFVRNAVLHDWADAVEGRNVPNPYTVTQSGHAPAAVVWDWFWRDRQHFHSQGGRLHGGPAYDALLSGNPVRDALDQLRGIF